MVVILDALGPSQLKDAVDQTESADTSEAAPQIPLPDLETLSVTNRVLLAREKRTTDYESLKTLLAMRREKNLAIPCVVLDPWDPVSEGAQDILLKQDIEEINGKGTVVRGCKMGSEYFSDSDSEPWIDHIHAVLSSPMLT